MDFEEHDEELIYLTVELFIMIFLDFFFLDLTGLGLQDDLLL
jgi:hypothetical protein